MRLFPGRSTTAPEAPCGIEAATIHGETRNSLMRHFKSFFEAVIRARPELMPSNPNGYVVRMGPDDLAAHDQLQHRVAVETHWPSDRQFDLDSLGDRHIRPEEYPTAADVNSAPTTAPETSASAQLVTSLKFQPVPITLPYFTNVLIIHDLCGNALRHEATAIKYRAIVVPLTGWDSELVRWWLQPSDEVGVMDHRENLRAGDLRNRHPVRLTEGFLQ